MFQQPVLTYLLTCLLLFKGKFKERRQKMFHLLVLASKMAATAKAEPIQSKESEDFSRSSM